MFKRNALENKDILVPPENTDLLTAQCWLKAARKAVEGMTWSCTRGESGWILGHISFSSARVVLTGRLDLLILLFQPECVWGREAAARSRDPPTVPALNAPQV